MLLSVCVAARYYSRLFEESLTLLQEQIGDEAHSCEIIVLFNAGDQRLVELADRASQSHPGITFVSYPGAPSRRDFFWTLAHEATGRYVWFMDDGVLPMKGSASLIMSILNDDQLAVNLRVLLLNSGKFANDFRKEMQSMEELVVFKTIKESIRFEKGFEFMNYFGLEDLLDIHAMVFEREAFLKTTFVQHPEAWENPHLRALVEMAGRGATCYFPRICTLARDSGIDRDLPRKAQVHQAELPWLYKHAMERGAPGGKARDRAAKLYSRHSREVVTMLLYREQFKPLIAQVWKHQSRRIGFWFTVFPLELLFLTKPARLFFRWFLGKVEPGYLYTPINR